MQVKITESKETVEEMSEAYFTFHNLALNQPASNVMVTDNTTGIILFTYENGNFTYVDGDFVRHYNFFMFDKKN